MHFTTTLLSLLAASVVLAEPTPVAVEDAAPVSENVSSPLDAAAAAAAPTCKQAFTVLGYSLAGCTSSAVGSGVAVNYRTFVNVGVNTCQSSTQSIASFVAFKGLNTKNNCYVRTYASSDCSTRQGSTCANGPTIKNGGECTAVAGSGGILGPVLGGGARSFKVVCGKRPAACTS